MKALILKLLLFGHGQLHCRDSVRYGEMLECVGMIERMKLKQVMENSLVFSVQIDGCVSRTMRYNKSVSCRTLSRKTELQTFFLGVHAPSKDGADGFSESLLLFLTSWSQIQTSLQESQLMAKMPTQENMEVFGDYSQITLMESSCDFGALHTDRI